MSYRYFYILNGDFPGKSMEISKDFYDAHFDDLTQEGHSPYKITADKVDSSRIATIDMIKELSKRK